MRGAWQLLQLSVDPARKSKTLNSRHGFIQTPSSGPWLGELWALTFLNFLEERSGLTAALVTPPGAGVQ